MSSSIQISCLLWHVKISHILAHILVTIFVFVKVEQQEMQHHQQLQQIQAQIRQQQQQMNMRYTNPSQQMRMGMNPGSNFGGMRVRMGGQQPNMRTNSIIGSMIGNGTSSNPINLEAVKSPPSGSKQGKSWE